MNYKLRELVSQQAQVLEQGDCRVGREEIMDLVIPEGSVSRHHANLHNSPEGVVWVIDLGSTNGTSVEGAPAKDWVQVHPGQVIRFGDVDLRLENETEAEQPSAKKKTPGTVKSNKEGKPKSVPAELGPNPTASGHLPKDLTEEQGNSTASPKNLLAVKPKKASGIVLPPRSALSAQIAPPDLPQQKIVSAQGVLSNGQQSSAIETLQLPSKEVLEAHRQVSSLVKRANAIAQSSPPERNTGEIITSLNQEDEIKAAEKNRQTDNFKLPPLENEANGHHAPAPRRSPEHDTSLERLRMAPEAQPAPAQPVVQATASPGAFVHPEPRQSARIQPVRQGVPQPVAAAPAGAAVPKAQVQPVPQEEESDFIVQPMSPMARMSREAIQNGPAVPAQAITAANAVPSAAPSPMVKASEVAYYKCMAFLGVGLFVGFVLGVVVCKYFL